MENSRYDYSQLYKIIIVGDAAVGKTHLLQKYVKGTLPKNPIPTIGVQFATKTVLLTTGQRIKVQLWDTAGQEQYRSITLSHYRKAIGAIIVYDITKQKSFKSVRGWIQNIRQLAEPGVVIMLVANKIDLPERTISKQEGRNLAVYYNILYQQISAKQSITVQQIFNQLIQQIKTQKIKRAFQSQINVQIKKQIPQKKSCQC